MSRNGSGTYVVPNTFTPSTTISSSAVNANFTDVGSELTNSVAADGQTSMTGPLKAADGTISAPGLSFSSDTNTGFYRSASGTVKFSSDGTNSVTMSASGIDALAVTVNGTSPFFEAGTVMLFAQTSAPTGWTKVTTHNNKALRVVSGSASSGGTVDFTTAFSSQAVSGTVGDTTLTASQIPAHTHFISNNNSSNALLSSTTSLTNYGNQDPAGYQNYALSGSATTPDRGLTSSVGGGGSHTHTFTGTAINLAVAYVDVILASKN